MKEQKKSSWGAVLVSFLKEFLLNSFEAPGHLYYDENLTNRRKKKEKLYLEGASTGDCGRSSFASCYSLEHVCSRCAMGKNSYRCSV